jgi:hypothetical protein
MTNHSPAATVDHSAIVQFRLQIEIALIASHVGCSQLFGG